MKLVVGMKANGLNRDRDRIELGFLEREATPESAMKLGIQMHLAGLSLSDTSSVLESMGVERHRTTIHRWVKKSDLQPNEGMNPDYVVPQTLFAEPANL